MNHKFNFNRYGIIIKTESRPSRHNGDENPYGEEFKNSFYPV